MPTWDGPSTMPSACCRCSNRFNLRWLEEPVIPDDIHGYAELKSYGLIPIAGGEHEFTSYGFRDLLEARALDYIQFDTNRVGGSRRPAKSRHWRKRIPSLSFRMPDRCTTITS